MLSKIIIWFLILNVVLCQLNGEFWWFNDKVTKLKGVEPPPLQFEEVSEFDTDESDKILFLKDDFNTNTNMKAEYSTDGNKTKASNLNNIETPPSKFEELKEFDTEENNKIVFLNNDFNAETNTKTKHSTPSNKIFKESDKWNIKIDKNKIVWPEDITKKPVQIGDNKTNSIQEKQGLVVFYFPKRGNLTSSVNKLKENFTSSLNLKKNSTTSIRTDKAIPLDDKIIFGSNDQKTQHSKNICTYLNISECIRRNGFAYIPSKRNSKNTLLNPQLICCILQSANNEASNIYFPGSVSARHKRSSSNEEGTALKQRDTLLLRKYSLLTQKRTPQHSSTQTTITHKIVTNDDYRDPYWNIKNSNKPNIQNNPYQATSTKYYDDEDYVEDYVVELPKPGLVGLYSDHGQRPSSWTFLNDNNRPYNGFNSDDEDSGTSFGYSTIDPRKGTKTKT